MKSITLAHGGGEEMSELLALIFSHFDNAILKEANDSALLTLPTSELSLTTDSFTLSPIFLDETTNIGKLAIAGTVNDTLMVGAKPEFLSLAFIIEEGFLWADFEKILKSIKDEAKFAGVKIVCGDTKVVPKGSADGLFINTTALGRLIKPCRTQNLKAGQKILLSGDVGRHGAAVLVRRNELEADIKSDCKSLSEEVLSLLNSKLSVVAMRDATRGGLSAVLNEWATQSGLELCVREEAIAVRDEVAGVCELFGFEPYELACEGTFVLAVEEEDAAAALEILRRFNPSAALIGELGAEKKARVILENAYGARRFLELPKGELLPRIC